MTAVQFLGGEDPLDKEMAAQFSILAWEKPMDERAWQAAIMGLQRVGHD